MPGEAQQKLSEKVYSEEVQRQAGLSAVLKDRLDQSVECKCDQVEQAKPVVIPARVAPRELTCFFAVDVEKGLLARVAVDKAEYIQCLLIF